jgi:hypothetical protein
VEIKEESQTDIIPFPTTTNTGTKKNADPLVATTPKTATSNNKDNDVGCWSQKGLLLLGLGILVVAVIVVIVAGVVLGVKTKDDSGPPTPTPHQLWLLLHRKPLCFWQ